MTEEHLYRCRFERKIGSSEGCVLCSSMQTSLSRQLHPKVSFPVKSSPFVLDKIGNKCVFFPSLAFTPNVSSGKFSSALFVAKQGLHGDSVAHLSERSLCQICVENLTEFQRKTWNSTGLQQINRRHNTLLRKGRCLCHSQRILQTGGALVCILLHVRGNSSMDKAHTRKGAVEKIKATCSALSLSLTTIFEVLADVMK